MRFIPYAETAATPNIIVDGPRNAATLVALSHWAKSGTPAELRADTSTEIVFRYLDTPRFHVDAGTVSNNHFDEDGLLGMFALLDRARGERHRDLLIDASRAGDFDVYRSREAARLAFALRAFADRGTSPLPPATFDAPHAGQTAALYTRMLDVLPALLEKPGEFRRYWEDEEAVLDEHEALLDKGLLTIEEHPALDLALVRAPEALASPHRFAIHSRTERTRIAILQGSRFEFYYRYEGWVQMASRRPMLRVDLSGLADELTLAEVPPARWVCEDAEDIVPRIYFEGDGPSACSPDTVLARVEQELRAGSVAWDPYE